MKKYTGTYRGGFSIIEVMIGIFVFSLGLVAIFALLSSSLNVNELNKNSIIAGQLAREQIELTRNIRDTNYKKLKLWNQQDPQAQLNIGDRSDASKVFLPGEYYFIENNYDSGEIEVENLGQIIPEGASKVSEMYSIYGLCFDENNRYIKCSASSANKTNFFRYLQIENARDEEGNIITDALVLVSKVMWYKRGYHEFEMKTIITDWRRI